MAGLAAIQYSPDSFDTRVGKLMGRQMAGETFFKAWIAHSGADPLTGWVHNKQDGEAFVSRAREIGYGGATALAAVGQFQALMDCGALWLGDPAIAQYSWDRRWYGQAAWSIVGITHTLSTRRVMDRLVALATAPVQPWDALICTSRAAKAMVERTLEAETQYLAERVGATRFPLPELPVIPLGVPCDSLVPDAGARARWRAELGIDDDAIAILQFGRISLHGKAHPLPLYLALERAATALGRLHLIFAGKFTNEATERGYHRIAAHFAGSVVTHFVDGLRPDVGTIRAAADIGTLLSDNVQETFGLAPVELMAAGLPVVGSDWDGLRDTIEHEVTGFRIATIMPPAGSGGDLAQGYAWDEGRFDAYMGATSQSTGVDIAAAAEAFVALAVDPDLRRSMGEAGRRRARALFDWPVVIGQYRALLEELGDRRRAAAGEVARPGGQVAIHPARLDPFDNFAGFASTVLALDTNLVRRPGAPARIEDLAATLDLAMLTPGALPPLATLTAMLAAVEEQPRQLIGLALLFPMPEARLYRGVGWLLKFGFLSRA